MQLKVIKPTKLLNVMKVCLQFKANHADFVHTFYSTTTNVVLVELSGDRQSSSNSYWHFHHGPTMLSLETLLVWSLSSFGVRHLFMVILSYKPHIFSWVGQLFPLSHLNVETNATGVTSEGYKYKIYFLQTVFWMECNLGAGQNPSYIRPLKLSNLIALEKRSQNIWDFICCSVKY